MSVLPLAGYDVDARGATLGLGAEIRFTPPRRALAISVRPSAEYVFAEDQPIVTFAALPSGAPNRVAVSVLRAGADVVGRVGVPGTPLFPYAKAGVAAEQVRMDAGGPTSRDLNLGATAGLGIEAFGVFVEGTLGTAAVSAVRVAVGVRF